MSGYKTLLPSEIAYIRECRRGLKDLGFSVRRTNALEAWHNELEAARKRINLLAATVNDWKKLQV